MELYAPRSVVFLVIAISYVAKGDVFTEEQTNRFVNFVEALRQCRGIVGVSTAVVKGNETWTRGFGMADVARGRNVSSSTLFGIGSITKAFTATLISFYINDSGRYSWETPLVDILGKDFKFINEELTRDVTLKDMLSHRTGLEAARIPLFAGWSLTRDEFTRHIRYLPVKKSFRDQFEYNNFLYGLAGHVVGVMGGATWEELLQTRLLQPLNMDNTAVLGKSVSVRADNFAKPYVILNNKVVPSDPTIYSISPLEAAGAMASSADDMARWLLLHIHKGRTESGHQLINEAHLREMSTAHVAIPPENRARYGFWKPRFPVTYASDSYGYGWFTALYRGYPMTWHSGSIFGYISYIALVPDLNLGVFVSTNGPGNRNASQFVRQLFYYIADLALGEEPWLNTHNACEFPKRWARKPPKKVANATVYTNSEFDNLGQYLGHYEHQLYGDVKILRNGSRSLQVRYGQLEGKLYRTEKKNVAMLKVLGSMAFLYQDGKRSLYLQMNFTRLSVNGTYQELVLSGPSKKEALVFQKEVKHSSSGGTSEGDRMHEIRVVIMLLVAALSLYMSRARSG